MGILSAEWKSKGKLYLLEIDSGNKNKTSFAAPSWVCNNDILVNWVKERMFDKSIPIFNAMQIVRNGILTNVNLAV